MDEMTEETYPVTPVEIIEWVVRADPDEPPPVIEGPITDANGDELEHGEPDYPGQFEETK
jgi:hypothetical protein